MSEVVVIPVKDVLPNPLRNLERLPLDEKKVKSLMASIKDTKFWNNLVLRSSPTQPGKFEIAYGHHRIEALRRLKWEEIKTVEIVDLDDTEMAQRMARENMEDWASNARTEQETIRSVIEAFAAGQVKLPTVKRKSEYQPFRLAPSFGVLATKSNSAHAELLYTAESLQKFLGWEKLRKVEDTLGSLAYLEEQQKPDGATIKKTKDEEQEQEDLPTFEGLTSKDFRELSTREAAKIVAEARYVEKELGKLEHPPRGIKQIAAKHARSLANGLREHRITQRSLRFISKEIVEGYTPVNQDAPKKLPTADKFIDTLAFQWVKLPTKAQTDKLAKLYEVVDDLSPDKYELLVSAMRGVVARWQEWIDKFETRGRRSKRGQQKSIGSSSASGIRHRESD